MMAVAISKNLKELFERIEHTLNKQYHNNSEVQLVECFELLDNYYGSDWENYCKEKEDSKDSKEKGYTKINLNTMSQYYDAWLICWDKGANSGIHDHAENGCIQKVLTGVLKETRYKKIKKKFNVIKETKMRQGNVCFIDNDIGYHRIENKSDCNIAVTLHIYSPPNCETHFYNSD